MSNLHRPQEFHDSAQSCLSKPSLVKLLGCEYNIDWPLNGFSYAELFSHYGILFSDAPTYLSMQNVSYKLQMRLHTPWFPFFLNIPWINALKISLLKHNAEDAGGNVGALRLQWNQSYPFRIAERPNWWITWNHLDKHQLQRKQNIIKCGEN